MMTDAAGATSGPWKLEPAAEGGPDGVEIVRLTHERSDPMYVEQAELPDLIGALMLYLDIQKIEAGA